MRVSLQSAILFAGALLLSTVSAPKTALAQEQTRIDDPMLKAMQAELEREKQQLVLPGMQRPYFIEYRLDGLETRHVADAIVQWAGTLFLWRRDRYSGHHQHVHNAHMTDSQHA